MSELVEPSCFIPLSRVERLEQFYLAYGGTECFMGRSWIEQLRMVADQIGIEGCIFSEVDLYRGWLTFLNPDACAEQDIESLQAAVYALLYAASGDTNLVSPDCFYGLSPDLREMAIFDAIGGGSGPDPDAEAYFARVDAEPGTELSGEDRVAVSAFIVSAKAHGYFTAFERLNLIVGGNLVTRYIPQVIGSGFDIDVPHGIIAGDFDEVFGIRGGTDRWIDTGTELNSISLGDVFLAYYGNGLEYIGSAAVMGADIGPASYGGIELHAALDGVGRRFYSDSNFSTGGMAAAILADQDEFAMRSLLIGNQPSTTSTKLYQDDGLVASSTNTTGSVVGTQTIYILAKNGNGTPGDFSSSTCGAYAIGNRALMDTEIGHLKTDLFQFLQAIGRRVEQPATLTPGDLSPMAVRTSYRRISPIGRMGSIIDDDFSGSPTEEVIGTGSHSVSSGTLTVDVTGVQRLTIGLTDGGTLAPYATAYAERSNTSGTVGVGWLFAGSGLERSGVLVTTSDNRHFTVWCSDEGDALTSVEVHDWGFAFTAPYSIAVEIRGICVNVWAQAGAYAVDGTWNLVGSTELLDAYFDFRLKAKIQSMIPVLEVAGDGSPASATFTRRGSTYAGEVGWREPSSVDTMDGEEYVSAGNRYVYMDAAGALDSIYSRAAIPLYGSIWTYNPVTKSLITEVAKHFFDDGTYVYGLEDASWVRDGSNWRGYWGDWAISDTTAGVVRLLCTTTTDNILSGIHVFNSGNTTEVTVPVGYGDFGAYATKPILKGGIYYLAGTYLIGDGWFGSPGHGTFLASGVSATNFSTLVGSFASPECEGSSLLLLDDEIYPATTGTDGKLMAYDDSLSNPVHLRTPIIQVNFPTSYVRHIGYDRGGGLIEHQFIDMLFSDYHGLFSSGPIKISAALELSGALPVPGAPTELDVTPSDLDYTAVWNATTYAAGYEVKLDNGSWVDVGNVLTTNGTSTDGDHVLHLRAYNSQTIRGPETDDSFHLTAPPVVGISFIAATVTPTGTTGGGGGTTPNINTTGANLIVMMVSSYSSIGSVSDSKGNTYTELTSVGSTNARTRIYYCTSPIVGASHSFTSTGDFPIVGAIAVAGAHASPFVSETTNTDPGSTSIQPGNITPVDDGSLLVASACAFTATGLAINSGFTEMLEDYGAGTNMAGGFGYLIQNPAAGVNPTISWTGSNQAAAAMALFKPA